LKGSLRVKFKDQEREVYAGQAVIAYPGEWLQSSSPNDAGAEYIAVCAPAFSPEGVCRDES